MARLADDLGLVLLNPELKPVIVAHRDARKAAAGAIAARQFGHQHEQLQPTPVAQARVNQDLAASASMEQGGAVLDVVPLAAVPEPIPVEQMASASGEDRLRAMVLAIDPRAKFEHAETHDRTRLYIGPIAAVVNDGEPTFAQHVGRGNYVIHRQLAPSGAEGHVIEARYAEGGLLTSTRPASRGERTRE